jgi:hypothetical protein
MDNIDITSSEFSLGGFPDFKNMMSSSDTNNANGDPIDYTMYMYIAVAILAIVGGYFIYKFYFSKSRHVHFNEAEMDCPGGFCTMGQEE